MFIPLRQGHVLHKVPTFAISLTTMAKPIASFNDAFYRENKYIYTAAILRNKTKICSSKT